ncbi:MAG: CcoQ/FixQ family Cbb3-type cytochrome c oxidase assembly chaperone [Gammaproteobacteria bacterium]|nr:CcoQ/FixQ family Cbb3-type cytochrome c oxidase assembly chaperone [Gammaproteobacteria bacterium]
MTVSILLFVLKTATFALIVGIAIWAFSGSRREDFEEAAMLPFTGDGDDEPVQTRGRGNG